MSYQIPVYRAERDAGLADQVRSAASVAYLIPVEGVDPADDFAGRLRAAAAAAASAADVPDDPDLFFTRDVLATVTWNKNDDVHERLETWAARHTSDHKPFNLAHDPRDIIGHILASEAFDAAMRPVPDDTPADEVPEKFHVVNGSVIYRHVGDPERDAQIERLIAEIKAGKWCVSMECLFRGFDYALRHPDGTVRFVARSAETAYLTKHLRAYGGSGVSRDPETGAEVRVGRVLRNVTFSGKGLVERPANPESVFLSTASQTFDPPEPAPVYSGEGSHSHTGTQEEIPMPETPADALALQARVDELAAANKALADELTALKNAGAEATIAGLRADVAAKEQAAAGLAAQVAAFTTTVSDVTARAEAAESARDEALAELATLRSEKARAARVAAVVGKGLEADKAEALVASLAALDEAAFASTVEVLAPTWKSAATPAPKPSETDAIDNATPEPDAALAAADEPEPAAASLLADFFADNLLRTTRGRKAS